MTKKSTQRLIVRFYGNEYEAIPQWGHYQNGRRALSLLDAETGEPLAKASVNLPEDPMESDEMALASGEVVNPLVDCGIIAKPHRAIVHEMPFGRVKWDICRVIDTPSDSAQPAKEYLGDGVYADYDVDGEMLMLTTENGYSATNTIYLESEVAAALIRFMSRLAARKDATSVGDEKAAATEGLARDGGLSLTPGVCCAYCAHFERDSCPVREATNWSRHRNWCSSYEPNPKEPLAKALAVLVT